MDDLFLLDAVERYLRGEMNDADKAQFEQLRNTNPDIDQLVVEQHAFLNQLEHFGRQKEMKHQLHLTHNRLLEQQLISETAADPKQQLLLISGKDINALLRWQLPLLGLRH